MKSFKTLIIALITLLAFTITTLPSATLPASPIQIASDGGFNRGNG